MRKAYSILILLSVLFISCSENKSLSVNAFNPDIEYWGRVDKTTDKSVELYWSGTSVRFNFEGESVKALLKDEKGDNYYNVIIDGDSISILRLDTIKQYYQLAANLPEGKHSIEIFKRTEWDRGKTNFYGLEIDGNAKLLSKSLAKKRKVEFYGNSITAGYAVEDTTGADSPDSTYTNNYLSYAAITARHFDAKYHCICKSGIGITISWFPFIMPDIYDRLNPAEPKSKWNFTQYTPDLVIVNLFQNDSWLVTMPEHEEFKTNFGNTPPSEEFLISAYQQFVNQLRNHYPKSNIICMLGAMDATQEGSKWPAYIKEAVKRLQDERIYTHFIPYKQTPGHPSVSEQDEMAKSLINFIDENINW